MVCKKNKNMKTKKISIPQNSLVYNYLPSDYSDSFECNFISSKDIRPDDVQIAFWTTKPIWIDWLLHLRTILVKPFGIKSDINDYADNLRECLINGISYKYISAISKSNNETVTCNVDKHLTFYLSIIVRKGEENKKSVIATTLVNFHNLLGRCYFFVIYPFHNILVRVMLKYLVKKIR